MNRQIADLFTIFLYAIMALVVARALMSWFSPRPDNQLWMFLNRVVDPLVEPIRKIMPRTGMIDFSTFILIILLQLMIAVVRQAASS